MNVQKILGYALGPMGSAVLGLILLPAISWYFPAEDIGRIALLQTLASLAILIFGLGLDQAYIREYCNIDNKSALLKTLAFPPLLFMIAVSIMLMLWDISWLSEMIFSIQDKTLGFLFLLFLVTTLLTRFLALILRMKEQALAFSLSQLTPKLLILLFTLTYIAFNIQADTTSLIFFYTFSQVLTVLVLLFQTKNDLASALHAKWSPTLYRIGIRYGLPLVFGNLAYWGLTSIDRFILQKTVGLAQLGIYSMAISFGAIALIFQSVFSTIWAPMVFKWVKENKNLQKINDIAHLITVLVCAAICIIGIMSPLISLMLPEEYATVQFILLSTIMLPVFYTLTEVSGIGLNIIKKTWLITLVHILCLLINLCLLYYLVPKLGAKGAAMANAVSFWLFFMVKTELSSYLWQPLQRNKIYLTMGFLLMLCLSYTFYGTKDNYPFFVLAWLCLFIITIWTHKALLKIHLKQLINWIYSRAA
ncbi:lipopolysaccharide biosynthesis protein [Neisseria sp. CCUG17229]|uniref:lipopolysaccharide biosynthesis protein n=1 Tax=Neisseria sp. CCUG17229 TaxID=3392036 RepID=UPI003A1019FE